MVPANANAGLGLVALFPPYLYPDFKYTVLLASLWKAYIQQKIKDHLNKGP